jgi:hypothetical protein
VKIIKYFLDIENNIPMFKFSFYGSWFFCFSKISKLFFSHSRGNEDFLFFLLLVKISLIYLILKENLVNL